MVKKFISYFLLALTLTTNVMPASPQPAEQFPIPEFLQKINYGFVKNDICAITNGLNYFFNRLTFELKPENDKEALFHSLTHILFRLTDHLVISEKASGAGELDTFVQNKNKKNIYIFEFKRVKRKKQESQEVIAKQALRQIFEKDYYKEHHQDGIPMTFVGMAFQEATSRNNFQNFVCGSLSVGQNPISLKVSPYSDSKIVIAQHRKIDEIFKYVDEHWSEVGISSLRESSYKIPSKYAKSNIYHNNLKNILLGIATKDIPLIIKNIECIIHSIPWSLRLANKQYYSAVVYTVLLCAGVKTRYENGKIIVTIPKEDHSGIKRNFVFIPSFSMLKSPILESSDLETSIDRFVSAELIDASALDLQGTSTHFIASKIYEIQDKKMPKGKIEFIHKYLKKGRKHYRDGDNKVICKTNDLSTLKKELLKKDANTVKSPSTDKIKHTKKFEKPDKKSHAARKLKLS